MKNLRDKVAVITGGAGGIGLALAKELINHEAKVVLVDIEQNALDAAVEEIAAAGGAVSGYRLDVSNFAQMDELVKYCEAEFGAAHLLFNNAGVSITGPIWECSYDDWDWIFHVNIKGVVNGIRAFVPHMLRHAEAAHVVNTGSLASFSGNGEHGPYCASKAAVLSISQTLYCETRALTTNIGVSIVCPGMVNTRINQSWRNRPAEHKPWSRRESEDPKLVAISTAIQERGESADHVAKLTIEGVLTDKFYIFTTPGSDFFVRSSVERAIAAQNPIVSTWGVDLRPESEREWSPWLKAGN